MEENLTLEIDRIFELPQKDWKQYSPLTLAYLGDAVYEIIIRTIEVKSVNCQPRKLHHRVSEKVNARTQSRMIRALLPHLEEEEFAVYRRGRNSNPYSKAKNATMEEYLEATGFEALIGYLYLKKDYIRMNELIRLGLDSCET